MNLIALLQKLLSHVGAILARHAGDQGTLWFRHASSDTWHTMVVNAVETLTAERAPPVENKPSIASGC
jgi:hypothetical protein